MRDLIKRNADNALLACFISSVLTLVIAVGSALYSYSATLKAQDRQVRLEQVSKFDASSAQIVEAAGLFISAVNTSGDVAQAKQKLSAVLAAQLHDAENLRKFYGGHSDKLIHNYQTAVEEFNQIAQKTSSTTEMRPWAETFGRMLDTKSNLSRHLHSTLGVRKTS